MAESDQPTTDYGAALAACSIAARLLISHDLDRCMRAIESAEKESSGKLGQRMTQKQQLALKNNRRVFEAALPLYRLQQEAESK